jgi:uncharacterized protein (TIGR03437 family)
MHYMGSNSSPVYEKFDLSALPNRTVSFFVADGGPKTYGPNDDFSSVLSQVREAALAWNAIDSSDLRVAFGGLESPNQSSNVPGGDVIFTDLPPGLLGMGGVLSAQSPIDNGNGPFYPVVRSTIVLTNDTSKQPGPSYLESYLTTAVHEMGHALGLQHTWTSAAMSQDVIRNTSRTRPLDADDYAGLSVLYGRAHWTDNFGTITGRVTANGQPVPLASVVVIPQIGPAVSSLTNPDGSYTISGVPPGTGYWLYVHPLPPDAVPGDGSGIRLPVDQNGNTIAPSGSAFRTIFLNDRNRQQRASIDISAGATFSGEDFAVTPQASVSMYDMVTYSYKGSAAMTPAYTDTSSGVITIVARANPPLTTPIPQSVTLLGGFASANRCASSANIVPPCFLSYGDSASPALAIYFPLPAFAGTGSRHMVFTLTNGDLYVLPDAVTLVKNGPPSIGSVSTNGNGTVTLAGNNFGADSAVYVDGRSADHPAFDGGQGTLNFTPPPGYGGQVASVLVFNPDGQNSTFYQTQSPPTFTYPTAGTPQFTVSAPLLPANVSSLIEINATNMQFADGQVTVGFGTTDVSVRQIWVVNPTRLVANVSVASGAATGLSEISVISGFQIASQPGGFQIQPLNANLPSIGLPLVNADPNQQIFYPGAAVTIYGSNLAASPNSVRVTLNDQPVRLLFTGSNQINFVIPDSIGTGRAALRVNNGVSNSYSVEMQIDNAPPVITQAGTASGSPLDASRTVNAGDFLVLNVSGVDNSVVGSTGRVHVTVAGVDAPVLQIASGTQKGSVQVTVVVTQTLSGSGLPVVVTVDGVRSSPYLISARQTGP